MAKEGIGTVQMKLVGEPYYNETVIEKKSANLMEIDVLHSSLPN
jgi:hypothetical protein